MTSSITTVAGRLASLRQTYEILNDGKRKPPTFSRWLRMHPEFVREKMETADRLATNHLSRDYREWVPDWRPGQPIMVGSGRRTEWCHIAYLQYALLAQILHERLGWTGQRVRDAARALQRGMDGGGHEWEPPAEPVPTEEMLSVARSPEARYDENALTRELADQRAGVSAELAVRRTQWRLWIGRVASHSWGSYMLDLSIAELRRDPEKKTPALIIGEIRRLRGDVTVTDYRGCSGCQYIDVVCELTAEMHEWLLSRAGTYIPVRCGQLDGICVPFGLSGPPEFDHCLELGLDYEIRVRQADWDALRGNGVTNIIAGGRTKLADPKA